MALGFGSRENFSIYIISELEVVHVPTGAVFSGLSLQQSE